MENLIDSIVGIVFLLAILGAFVGYCVMAWGIGEAWGPPFGIFAFVTILGVFIMAFLGIWYNQKIQTGAAIMGGSMAVIVILTLYIG